MFMVLVFWRPQEWLVPVLYGWPLLDAIVYAALLSLILESSAKRIEFPSRMSQIWLLVGLWFAAVISHVPHTYLAGALNTMGDVFKYCFFTLLLFCVLDRPSRLRKTIVIFVGMCAFMAVHALMQKHLGYGFGGQRPISQYRPSVERFVYRSLFFGIFGDPNDLAQILITAIPLAFALSRRRTVMNFIFSCSIAVLLVMGALATGSRGGFVALAAVSAVMVLLVLPRRWLAPLLVMGIVAGLPLCLSAGRFMDMSAADRVDFWGQANWAFKENIFFGVGYDMIGEYITKSRAVHNAFVLAYAELGVFGYWFWFILLQLAIVGAWRTRTVLAENDDPEARWLGRTAGLGISAMAGFTASAYFLSRAFVYPIFFLMAILGAMPYIAKRHFLKDLPDLIDAKQDVWIMGTIGSLVSIVYIYISILLLNKAFHG